MYLEHFGFNRHPFRMSPEEDFIYMSLQHSRAYVFMETAIWSSEGFVVISGEIGSGKTTLLKKMISGIQDSVHVLHIAFTNLSSDDLFQMIIQQAGIQYEGSSKAAMLLAISEFLKSNSEDGNVVLLAIDEAQNLTNENLEDIRMLEGMEGEDGPILRVILLGQPELKDHIAAIPQLSQRVKLFYHLKSLSLDDTINYIDHRLNIVGNRNKNLFPSHVIDAIYNESSGIPRLVNKIADGLLLCAFAEDRNQLLVSDIDEIRDEILIAKSRLTPELATFDSNSGGSTLEGIEKALNRIASSLEKIEDRLSSYTAPAATKPHVRNRPRHRHRK